MEKRRQWNERTRWVLTLDLAVVHTVIRPEFPNLWLDDSGPMARSQGLVHGHGLARALDFKKW